jgi:hypothetical protein
VAVADFDRDGKLDAVTSDGDTGTVRLMLGSGNATMTKRGTYPVGSSHNSITTGDFNRDGRSDVAVTNTGSNTISVP